ncbi:MAG: hypothetical protein ACRD3N_11180 [Terracidiphilus sp.]
MTFEIGLWLVFVTPFLVLPASWTIFRKAGFHPGWGVFTLVPVINIFVLYHVAFSKWPDRPFESEIGTEPET